MKKQVILIFLVPLMNAAITFLRNVDKDDRGLDDEAANALEYALGVLLKYMRA